MRPSHLIVVAAVALAGCVGSTPTLPPVICTTCGTACVDLQTDSANCGACGKPCAGGLLCKAGACVPTCPTATVLCGSACVDPATSGSFCGAKGDCKTEDASNSAGKVCAMGQFCVAGACTTNCGKGQLICGSQCIDPLTDSSFCGAKGDCTTEDSDNSAGQACADGKSCVAGACTLVCAKGETICNKKCVTTISDPANCGACGKVCPANQVCSDSNCADNCGAGLVMCDGWIGWQGPDAMAADAGAGSDASTPAPRACVNPLTDDHNCSGCGLICGRGQSCVAGACANPQSCADLQAKKGPIADGEYVIDPDGSGPLKPFSVYCHGMAGAAPKAYLTFPHSIATGERGSNYIEANQDASNGGCGTIHCEILRVLYTRVPIDIDKLVLLPGDDTFSYVDNTYFPDALACWKTLSGDCATVASNPSYGVAFNCGTPHSEVSGRANIDLRDTPFVLDVSVVWTSSEPTGGQNVVFSTDRDVVDVNNYCDDQIPNVCAISSPQPGIKLQQR
jgi:hypothetical protein